MVDVVSRASWGARPWSGKVYEVPLSVRTEVLIHYHGHPPLQPIGPAMAREVDAIHHANGWSGVGYNWLVDQAGTAFEGRGWDLVGAHCPGHNRTGFGIYVAIGDDQVPTDAALATVRALYDETCQRTGRSLRKTWHGANYPTACPGARLIAWVHAGMPAPTTSPEGPMSQFTLAELAGAVADETTGADAKYRAHDPRPGDPDKLLGPAEALTEILASCRRTEASQLRTEAAVTALTDALKGGQ